MRHNHPTIVLILWAIAAFSVTGCQKTPGSVTIAQNLDYNPNFFLSLSRDFRQNSQFIIKKDKLSEERFNQFPDLNLDNNYIAQTPQPGEKSNSNFLDKLLIVAAIGGVIGLILWMLRSRLFSTNSKLSATVSKLQVVEFQKTQFTTITLDKTGQIIDKTEQSADYFPEKLSQNVSLDMIYLRGGIFTMGTSLEEGKPSEKPQHEVTIEPFFMAKYPITQAQWKAIAMLPAIKRSLNLDPSKYKGDNLPVENVSWYDAVEFCQRLSQLTQRQYRLPTEAEWEYATRATTNTPFYFGETITTDLANYKGIFSYALEPKGKDRHQTTEVNQFTPNAFGLWDLHGNVGEWCADTWHDNYQNAPSDGKAWIKNKDLNHRVCSPVRGGGWIGLPDDCRSAARRSEKRNQCHDYIGFRVVCDVGNIVIPELAQ